MAAPRQVWHTRFAALDPLLRPVPLPRGVPLATGPDFGVLTRTAVAPTSWQALWGASVTYRLSAVPGADAVGGMRALLEAWEARRPGDPERDSVRVVTWPSRDLAIAEVLLAKGFVPEIVLAVRRSAPSPCHRVPGVGVRAAREADIEEIVALRLAELEYAALVGPSVRRPGAAALLATETRRGLRFGARVLIADRDGVAAGLVAFGGSGGTPSGGDGRLPEGRWGHLGTLAVSPAGRGHGIGRTLAAAAHRELDLPGVRGTFLYYHPANPLSTVFWHRQGYRPLWTTWARRHQAG
ncbi:GNAT family N-acetyltransferase [Amycolatopsis sp. NPDC059021]|uniref:GNAT family N-acetyltransferase n=1 Tax=Amycolatopsis sp. NPDC059021 TaxID=3346704 RepID=UPI00366C2DCC